MVREVGVGPSQPGQIRILVQGDANRTGLIGECLENGLADPPNGVRNELDAFVWIELFHRLEKPLIADTYELGESQSSSLILLHVRDNEAEIRRNETFGGFFVADTRSTGELALFLGVLYARVLLYVLQVLIK